MNDPCRAPPGFPRAYAGPVPEPSSPSPHQDPPGDRATVAGVVLLAIGAVAVVVTLVPLFTDNGALPLPFYLLSLLAPIGLGVILVSLWRRAVGRSARLRK